MLRAIKIGPNQHAGPPRFLITEDKLAKFCYQAVFTVQVIQ